MEAVVVDRIEIAHGYVSLSDGQVCDIISAFDMDGDELDSTQELGMVSAVLFIVPGVEQPFVIPVDRFHNPTVH